MWLEFRYFYTPRTLQPEGIDRTPNCMKVGLGYFENFFLHLFFTQNGIVSFLKPPGGQSEQRFIWLTLLLSQAKSGGPNTRVQTQHLKVPFMYVFIGKHT